MKKLLSIFVVLLLAVSAFAQNPKLNYQAVIRDSENKLVVEQPVTVTVNVLKADNTSQFVQTLNATTNRNGLLSLKLAMRLLLGATSTGTAPKSAPPLPTTAMRWLTQPL